MEPLKTDEPLPPGQKRKGADFENQIIGGCGAFVAGSILVYFLSIWPFLLFQEIAKINVLLQGVLFGLLPAYLFGIVLCRKAGLAGACAFCAGSLTVSVFLYLRIEQVFLEFEARQGVRPSYPHALQVLIPVSWALFCIATAMIVTPKSEISLK